MDNELSRNEKRKLPTDFSVRRRDPSTEPRSTRSTSTFRLHLPKRGKRLHDVELTSSILQVFLKGKKSSIDAFFF